MQSSRVFAAAANSIELAAARGSNDDIATNMGVGGSTVYRTKHRFVFGNLEVAFSEEPCLGSTP